MGKRLDSKQDLSSIFKISKRAAIEEAKKNSIDLGGVWHVVKLDEGYVTVHEIYLKRHTVKSLYASTDPYSVKDKRRIFIPFINLATKIITTLTKYIKKWQPTGR